MRDTRLRALLDHAIREAFYRYEGKGLSDDTDLWRCLLCGKGWQEGGMFGSGPQHHAGCRIEVLLAALLIEDASQHREETKNNDKNDDFAHSAENPVLSTRSTAGTGEGHPRKEQS